MQSPDGRGGEEGSEGGVDVRVLPLIYGLLGVGGSLPIGVFEELLRGGEEAGIIEFEEVRRVVTGFAEGVGEIIREIG